MFIKAFYEYAALKSLSDSSNNSVTLELAYIVSFFFPVKIEIFLPHGMIRAFQLKPEHSECSDEILNFFEPAVCSPPPTFQQENGGMAPVTARWRFKSPFPMRLLVTLVTTLAGR